LLLTKQGAAIIMAVHCETLALSIYPWEFGGRGFKEQIVHL